ncbi:acyl-CoA thioesterase [Bacillus benzoevorans]|uniref:YbgC/YbaW family acyl-CoA thioester hydrolase n=1 Tax=Bacillus benzoevorans TaxID=1456 RepID=A0A7X0HVH9_9BACI|nr:thioesterase family protein [Bacillus benzoevorans]MBB6447645.1 YbgC/YbaW family acyl-CoA thioester hydrolase [Bacillus benzoevorans]
MITKKIRIQFVDTDASGRIHYSAIFRYFEIMDHDFFRRIGYSYKKIITLGLDIPRVHVECNYLGNIEYDDELEVRVSISKIGNSSYTLSFGFYKEDVLVAKGSLTNVFVDRESGKSVKIPEFIKTELAKHLEPVSI